jgi:2-aminoethylphosphonate-pyruvate transaminase
MANVLHRSAFARAASDSCPLARAAQRTYYLDLGRLARLQDERGTLFTPAVHAGYGLVEALREFTDEGGRSARHRRYATLAERVRADLPSAASNRRFRLESRRWSCALTGYREV